MAATYSGANRGGVDRDIELARAHWSLRFYCWRNLHPLFSVGTVVAAEAILASIEGRPPQKDIIDLVSRLYRY